MRPDELYLRDLLAAAESSGHLVDFVRESRALGGGRVRETLDQDLIADRAVPELVSDQPRSRDPEAGSRTLAGLFILVAYAMRRVVSPRGSGAAMAWRQRAGRMLTRVAG